jgi:hypothetical protein
VSEIDKCIRLSKGAEDKEVLETKEFWKVKHFKEQSFLRVAETGDILLLSSKFYAGDVYIKEYGRY